MKKLLLVLLFVLANYGYSQLLMQEDFNYAAGALLSANGWSVHSGTTNFLTVVAPGLSYTGYSGSAVGNAVGLTTSGEDANLKMAGTDSVTSGSVYAAFMVNVSAAQAAGDYFFHFSNKTMSTSQYRARTYCKLASNGKLAFGLLKSSATAAFPIKYSDSVYVTGTTYLLVVKYSFSSAGTADDTVSLFVNPVMNGTEPLPNVTHFDNTAATAFDLSSFGAIALRQGSATNAATLVVDGIHIASSWGALFNVVPPSVTSINLNVKDNAATTTDLTFGFAPNATDGIDASLGENALPPFPPSGVFDARLVLPNGTEASLKDYRSDTLKAATWTVKFQPSAGGYPFTMTWNPANLPDGSFFLVDNITGTLVNVNMKTTNTVSVTNSGISTLLIKFSKQLCKDVILTAGWNMFGVPLNAADMTVATLFPAATSQVYGYNAGYTTAASVVPGKGYWVRHPDGTVNVCGAQVAPQTVDLVAGWNMISVYENDIAVSAVTTTPAGIINSLFYGFNNGYTSPTTLASGKGYWVRASAGGVMNLSAKLFKTTAASVIPSVDSKWSSVILSDAAGNKSNLYFSSNAQDLSKYELPPVPPAGIFDVRFASQSSVENLGTSAKVINISGATYPVELRAEGIELAVRDLATGKLINTVVKSGSSIVITNENINAIEVSANLKPAAYELLQNYPNPFNPSTMIRFGIPENAHVRMTVFNQIGETVAELVNGQMEAGYHQVLWNAANMSSGVYFYEIKTDNFKAVKKLILMK